MFLSTSHLLAYRHTQLTEFHNMVLGGKIFLWEGKRKISSATKERAQGRMNSHIFNESNEICTWNLAAITKQYGGCAEICANSCAAEVEQCSMNTDINCFFQHCS